MKLIIGYDGSDFADAAIDDLQRAGLADDTVATVVSVAEVWPALPASAFKPRDDAALRSMPASLRRAHELAAAAISEAKPLADAGVQRVRNLFPRWNVSGVVQPGSAANVLLDLAEQQAADLVVVGSCGKTGVSRLMLGSVSQKVLNHARCSVRIGRRRRNSASGTPVLLIGIDGSAGADAAVQAVAARSWPSETQACIVAALDVRLTNAFVSSELESPRAETADAQRDWINRVVEEAAQAVRAAGVMAVAMVKEGDARRVLVEEAESRSADCIFVGATGMGQIQRFLLGSVSTAVASHAPCSVEIVRPPRG